MKYTQQQNVAMYMAANFQQHSEGISKLHSIWFNEFGDIKGSELSCTSCTVKNRCKDCNEKVPEKKTRRSKKIDGTEGNIACKTLIMLILQ